MRAYRRAALAVAVISLGFLLVPMGAGARQDTTAKQTVTVGAKKTIDVEPDLGIIVLGVSSKGATAVEANDRLIKKAQRVVAAWEDMGFDDEIDTPDISLFRDCLRDCRDRNPNDEIDNKPVFGFRGRATIRLETDRLDDLGEVIDVGVEAGADSIRGVSFTVSDKSEAVKEALRQAMIFATEKAQILADVGNAQLGPAIVITEGSTRAPRTFEVAVAAFGSPSPGAPGGGGSDPTPFPIKPPTLSASARVTATFTLEGGSSSPSPTP